MKPIQFLGDSLKRLREFPPAARQDAGHQLYRVQRGEQPDDFKPTPTVGKGVEEIRVWDETGIYRVIYTAPVRRKRSTCCTPSKRKRPPHRNATWTSPRRVSLKSHRGEP